MKRLFVPALVLAGWLPLAAAADAADPPRKQPSSAPAPASPPPGMKIYYVGLLKRGPQWNAAEGGELEKYLADHVAYLARLEKEGKVTVAGTFLGSAGLRGMVIYQARSLAEARSLVRDDPAVQSGRLLIDLYPWLSAEGLRVVAPAAPPRPPAKAPPKKAPATAASGEKEQSAAASAAPPVQKAPPKEKTADLKPQ